MRGLAVLVLRSRKLWPAALLVVLAVAGLISHLVPAGGTPSGHAAAAAATAAAAPATNPAAGSVSATNAAGSTGALAARPAAPATGTVAASGATNAKSRPIQAPASPVTAATPLPAPTAAVYNQQPYHTPTAIAAWTGAPDPAVHALIVQYFPAGEVANADQVSLCESGQRSVVSAPNSNGSRDHGIFQLNDGGTLQHLLTELGQDPTNLDLALDPQINVRAAALLFSQRGWQPWTCAAKLGIVAGLYSSQPGPNAGN